jgi:mannose-6-phosphate isomerase-like protein (cupin superfamily)
MIHVTPVILCGGSGTRLWPLSRAGFPKQFLSLTGSESLFQLAAQRLVALGADNIQVAKPLIVTGEEHRFLASEQLREAGIELAAALLEPVGRNTAPALTLAALAAQANGEDPVLVVTPADQTVADTAAFTQAMREAIHEAGSGSIVVLGISPDRPETGYGYIQVQAARDKSQGNTLETCALNLEPVLRFVEKPNAATAQQYLNEGGRFKVKRIQVKPGASLSLQKHHHRAEHWIVVKGTAEITNGSKGLLLSENQSTYIPLGEVHRLCNPGSIPLEIIEVQSGSYLGEDDIVRFEDHYGRTQT